MKMDKISDSNIGEDKFKYLLDQLLDATLLIDWKGSIIYANNACSKLVEVHDVSDYIGKNVMQFVHPSSFTNVVLDILSVKKGEGGFLSEYKAKTAKGNIIWVEGLGKKIDFEGKTVNLVTLRDITQRKKKQIQNELTERKYSLLYQRSPFGVFLYNKDNIITDCNDKFTEILHINKNSLIGLDMKKLIDKSIDECIRSPYQGKEGNYEGQYNTTLSNKKIWISLKTSPIYDTYDKIDSAVGIVEDITEKRISELSIKKYSGFLKAISLSAEAFLKSSDWEKNISRVIKQIGNAANVSRVYIFQNISVNDDVVSNQLYEWVNEGVTSEIDNPLLQNLSFKEAGLNRWIELLKRDRIISSLIKDLPEVEQVILIDQEIKSILIVPLFLRNYFWGFIGFDECKFERSWSDEEIEILKIAGGILGAAIQRKQFEDELIISKERAEKSDQLKSEFLAQMSHEIRTPINTILSFISLIKDDVEKYDIKLDDEPFDIISAATERIIRTIDSILNMSELQTGSYEAKIVPIELKSEVLENLTLEFKVLAEEKGLEFKFTCLVNGSATILADTYSIHQIFVNLLDNAIKYTNAGEVELSLKENSDSYLISVRDTGIGISEDYLADIFRAFSQEEQGYSRKFEGNGLGLALVKNYCKLNNAEIKVKSKKNEGSTFTVIFPKTTN